MSADILKRRIAARQRIKEIGDRRFTLRRPTEFEIVKFARLTVLEYVCECTDDCNLTEADLINGGSAEVAVPFDRAVFFDWMQEHPEYWKPLTDELNGMVAAHNAALEEAAKN